MISNRRNHDQIDLEHLLAALLEHTHGIIPALIKQRDEDVREELDRL